MIPALSRSGDAVAFRRRRVRTSFRRANQTPSRQGDRFGRRTKVLSIGRPHLDDRRTHRDGPQDPWPAPGRRHRGLWRHRSLQRYVRRAGRRRTCRSGTHRVHLHRGHRDAVRHRRRPPRRGRGLHVQLPRRSTDHRPEWLPTQRRGHPRFRPGPGGPLLRSGRRNGRPGSRRGCHPSAGCGVHAGRHLRPDHRSGCHYRRCRRGGRSRG